MTPPAPACDICHNIMQFYSADKETRDHQPGIKYVYICGCLPTGVRYQTIFVSEAHAQP